jgi:hypothetical protein
MGVLDTAFRLRIKARGRELGHRLDELHSRYARLFWGLHSAWAMFTGGVVLVLAHNRYGFLKWAVLFMALTWASTLFFSRFAAGEGSKTMRIAKGFVSYLTRVMYQETLFFLLPFYFYSTTFPSWNCAYVIVLAGLALLSCFDMLFDSLLRERKWFALAFFAVVTFSALQFLFPLVLKVHFRWGAYLAALLSLAAAVPLAYSWAELRQPARFGWVALALVLSLGAVKLLRFALPPVPLRLTKVRVTGELDRRTVRAAGDWESYIPIEELSSGHIYVVFTVFSPARIPATLRIRFLRDGETMRWSKNLTLVAHDKGFRIWDSLRAGPGGFKPGNWTTEVWTDEGQLVGRRHVRLLAPGEARPSGS